VDLVGTASYMFDFSCRLYWMECSIAIAYNRNEYQESLKIKKPGGKVRPAHRADNLATIC
jgi:hypothetical protein